MKHKMELVNHTPLCCYAPDTLILMADGTLKPVQDIENFEWILSTENEKKEVGCTTEEPAEEYYILKTEEGHEIRVTGEHPMMTDKGWKLVKRLEVGAKLARWNHVTETTKFDTLVSIEQKEYKGMVYNLICDDCAVVANGFVCGDFHVQYQMSVLSCYLR